MQEEEVDLRTRSLISLIVFLLLPILVVNCAEWRQGRYWYIVDNIKIKEGESPEILLWAALPMNHRGQRVKIERIYPEPVEIIHDSINGNEIVFWRVTELEAEERIFFFYDFQILSEKVETRIEPEKIGSYDKESAEYMRYTISEPWIEISPEIKEKARELVGEEPNPYFQAKRIFDWVIENMSYEYPDIENRGAEKSFKSQKGDCGEFSFVFIALCRAVGIPAREVTCIWFTRAGHAWAEILIPPYGWVPVDASVAQLLMPGGSKAMDSVGTIKFMESRGIPEKDPYYLFGNLYPNRVIVCIGNNIEVFSKRTGVTKTFRFMQPGGATAYPPGIDLRGLSDEAVHVGFYVFGEEKDNIEHAMAKAEEELAPAYLRVGSYDKAEQGFLKKLEGSPENALAWLNLGQVYMCKEDYDTAIDALTKCLMGKAGSMKPVLDVWAHSLLGNCYDLKGMREQAITEYQNVIKMDMNFQGAVDSAKKYIKEPYRKSEE